LSAANERLQRELLERQRVEAAVRASEERFRILFEHSPDAILLIDPHGPNGHWSIVDCNEVAGRMNGYRREELIGQSLQLLMATDPDPAAVRARLAELRQAGTVQGEVVRHRKDGTLVWIEYSGALISLAGAELVLGIERDISARKQAEQALQTARGEAERLEELDRLRDQFIAMVSHDLRTPLTAARAALILLQTSALEKHGPAERALVDNARRNIDRLNLLIDDLLTLNQCEAGILRLDCEPLDLRAVVTDAIAAVHPLIREKGQALEVDLPEPLPTDGDARRLEQVLVNLLANAHHYTPAGTRITVSARSEEGAILLSVRDTGPGIPPEELECIFERFHRLTSADGGSGLGLTIALSLVQLHHGRIWAESGPGAGATFCVALPRSAQGGQP
jgi:PAS domain S-box-containing protein